MTQQEHPAGATCHRRNQSQRSFARRQTGRRQRRLDLCPAACPAGQHGARYCHPRAIPSRVLNADAPDLNAVGASAADYLGGSIKAHELTVQQGRETRRGSGTSQNWKHRRSVRRMPREIGKPIRSKSVELAERLFGKRCSVTVSNHARDQLFLEPADAAGHLVLRIFGFKGRGLKDLPAIYNSPDQIETGAGRCCLQAGGADLLKKSRSICSSNDARPLEIKELGLFLRAIFFSTKQDINRQDALMCLWQSSSKSHFQGNTSDSEGAYFQTFEPTSISNYSFEISSKKRDHIRCRVSLQQNSRHIISLGMSQYNFIHDNRIDTFIAIVSALSLADYLARRTEPHCFASRSRGRHDREFITDQQTSRASWWCRSYGRHYDANPFSTCSIRCV
jgi:hypothetical protein